MTEEQYHYLLERISKLDDKIELLSDAMSDIFAYVEAKQKAEEEGVVLLEKRYPLTEKLFGR